MCGYTEAMSKLDFSRTPQRRSSRTRPGAGRIAFRILLAGIALAAVLIRMEAGA